MTAPKTSGIAAAIGERKTSRRTRRRIGRAISSLRSAASIDSSWIARERVAYPVWVALTGGWICRPRIASSSSTESLTDSASPTWKSITISACRGLGRRRPTEPRSQGERVVTRGSLARRARTSSGPWRSIAAAGPRRSTANGAERPKCSRRTALAFEEGVPGTSSEVGLRRLSTPVPSTPSTASTRAAIASTARG